MGINVSGALAGLTIKKHMCSKTNAKDKWGNSCKIKKIVFKVKKKKTPKAPTETVKGQLPGKSRNYE